MPDHWPDTGKIGHGLRRNWTMKLDDEEDSKEERSVWKRIVFFLRSSLGVEFLNKALAPTEQ